MGAHVPSIECRCGPTLTCGYCLRNAPPWFNTPSTIAEQASKEAHARWLADNNKEDSRAPTHEG